MYVDCGMLDIVDCPDVHINVGKYHALPGIARSAQKGVSKPMFSSQTPPPPPPPPAGCADHIHVGVGFTPVCRPYTLLSFLHNEVTRVFRFRPLAAESHARVITILEVTHNP